MGIAVEVPGLDGIIPEVPDGQVVILESGADPAKNFFVRRLVLTALGEKKKVVFVWSRDRADLLARLREEGGDGRESDGRLEIFEEDTVKSLDEYGQWGGLLAVDSFSLLTLDSDAIKLAGMLRSLRAICHERGTTVVLGTDRGMLEPRSEAVTSHLADGVLQFHAKEAPEGLARFLRITKWTDGRFMDRNIYYDFDGRRMAIDLRRRVL